MANLTSRTHQMICLLTALVCAVPSMKASAEPFNFQTPVIKGTTDANGGAGGGQAQGKEEEYFGNPIHAYFFIKHLSIEWDQVKELKPLGELMESLCVFY